MVDCVNFAREDSISGMSAPCEQNCFSMPNIAMVANKLTMMFVLNEDLIL